MENGILKTHLRRLALEALNAILGHDCVYQFVGFLNKKFGLIKSVFLVYPASDAYALHYLYASRLHRNRWNPYISGFLWQNGKVIIMFSISSHVFEDISHLRAVEKRMEKLRVMLCADKKTFAGILPGVLFRNRIIRQAPEADLTAFAVSQAIALVKKRESLDPMAPVIVLGARGFIGRRVLKLLSIGEAYSVDVADDRDSDDWPEHLFGRRVIVVNITKQDAINNYLERIWPGTIIINEVYPEPSSDVLDFLKRGGCSCYHVVGVVAKSIPAFPAVYKGAIPCCAAWDSPEMEVVVRKLI